MKTKPVVLILVALLLPAAAQAQEGARVAFGKPKEIVVVGSKAPDAQSPYVIGRLYNRPTRALLLEPGELESLAAGEVRTATLAVPEGPLAEASRWAFENRQTIGDLSLSIAPTGERAKYHTITLKKVYVARIAPTAADGYGRVKVQFHWDRTGDAAVGPLIGWPIGAKKSEGNEDSAAEPPAPSQGWYATRPYVSLVVDGVEIASFSEAAGLDSRTHPTTIVLKRGKTRSRELWRWHEAASQGLDDARKNGSIVQYDTQYGKPVARYTFTNAWPSKIELGSLKAGASEVLMETVTIVCENIQRVAP